MTAKVTKKKIVKVVDIVASGTKIRKIPTRKIDEDFSIDKIKSETIKEFEKPIDHNNWARKEDEYNKTNIVNEEIINSSRVSRERMSGKKKFYLFSGGLITLAILLFLFSSILPRVDIKVVTKKVQAEYSKDVVVSKDSSSIDLDLVKIPGEILTKKNSTVIKVASSGKKYIEQRATGKITIFNAYSIAPQSLVANTRFETPDGKTYRIVERIVIPGAKKVGDQLEPSMIDVKVVADKAGPNYNIGPVAKFTIPGFASSDKFKGFYASSDSPMSGGFIGEGAMVSDADIEKAKKDAQDKLRDAIIAQMKIDIAQDPSLKILDGAQKFTISKENVDPTVDESGQFSISLEGELSAMVFKEADAVNILRELYIKENKLDEDLKEKDFQISYLNPVVDWQNGKMTLPVTYKATLWIPFNTEEMKNSITGFDDIKLKQSVLDAKGIDKVNVMFWPFYVNSVPNKISKINITVE